MKVKSILPILAIAAILAACSTNEELALLHDDDTYFNPDKKVASSQETVTSNAFVEEGTQKTAEVDDFDYYDPDAAEQVKAPSTYYDAAYNTPQYYNYDRFRFNVGFGYSTGPSYMGMSYGSYYGSGFNDPYSYGYGWGNSYNYGYSPWGYGGVYGWSPYYGYGGYYGGYGYGGHCPSIYGGGWYGGDYYGGNTYYGHRPTTGGGSVSSNGTMPYYRSPNSRAPRPSSTSNGDQRMSGTPNRISIIDMNERQPNGRPSSNKQPVYYSPERIQQISPPSQSHRNNSGFMNFIRESGNSMSVSPNGGGRENGSRVGGGGRSGSSSPSARPSSSPSSRPAASPSNSGGRR